MATNKTTIENVELGPRGEVSIYINNSKASLGVESGEVNFSVWLTIEELASVAKAIKKALEQAE